MNTVIPGQWDFKTGALCIGCVIDWKKNYNGKVPARVYLMRCFTGGEVEFCDEYVNLDFKVSGPT